MANPQLENGFTKIAHEIMEALAKINLSPYESRVLWFVLRKTYGWNKKSDWIASTQFRAGLGGLDRSNIARAKKSLLSRKIIVVSRDHGGNPIYSFQKDYSKWTTLSKQTTPVVSRDTSAWSPETPTIDTLTKDTKERVESDKPIPDSSFTNEEPKSAVGKQLLTDPQNSPHSSEKKKQRRAVPAELQPAVGRIVGRFNELCGTKYRPDSKIVLNGMVRRLAEGATEQDCLTVIEDKWRDWQSDEKMRRHFNPETLFRETNFEKYLNAAQSSTGNGNGHAPSKVEFLDNGMVKVDGFTMSRADYERRNAKRQRDTQVH